MIRLLVCPAALILLTLVGCQSERVPLVSLENPQAAASLDQMSVAPQSGVYYLYSSNDAKKPLYQLELKKGDPIGFKVVGKRVQAIAKGIVVELTRDDYEGASYTWKYEPKKD